MLEIQRASAGSGKTYTLTRNYILHLIAYCNENGKWCLRRPQDVNETLGRILAITFTNKATNEMKERIVEKLAALSDASEEKKLTPSFIENTDYLKYLAKLTGSDYKEIGLICKHALNCILNNYSKFHIATIDSFFQEILRTFAYEVNLNDSYQLEIDSEFLSASAIDSSLNEFDKRGGGNPDIKFWLKILMEKELKTSQRWNVFTKSTTSNSIYNLFKQALSKLDGEDYKNKKDDLDRFFEDENASEKLKYLYLWLKTEGRKERETALKNIKKQVQNIRARLLEYNLPYETFYNKFYSHLDKIDRLEITDKVDFKAKSFYDAKTVTKKGKEREGTEEIDKLSHQLYGDLISWNDPYNFPKFTTWNLYGELLPYFGLILEVNKKMSTIMIDNNLIKLSDTSGILKKIIGEDDTPFIYERLGNYIDNFLIDEFQDTSRMQWDILRPLLKEGNSKGYDNLIIGDPKQSIYRFRNADHKLIIEDVPQEFKEHRSSGLSKEENTNWRSRQKIVKFNNFFFKTLSGYISEISKEEGRGDDFEELYRNVIQYPASQDDTGYVEIRFINSSDKEKEEETKLKDKDKDDDYRTSVLNEIGVLISELLKRGYHKKDIAILVNKNEYGRDVIKSLINYNDSLLNADEKIDFISEESLLISSSEAVTLIISVLEKISYSGINRKTRESGVEEDINKKNYAISWHKIKVDYQFFSLSHPELSLADKVIKFLHEGDSDKIIDELIRNLETPTLEAIIELIVSTFIDIPTKSAEAIYISALQDLVKEYNGRFSNDITSFLEWWKTKGKQSSVSSPEGIDAVQVMTIHKSKGLEFKCVIIPFANDSFRPSSLKSEWRWVKPVVDCSPDLIVPYLPIKTSSQLLGTPHENIYREYIDQIMTDKLNMYYVAFTRAKNELYILSKKPDKNSSYNINGFLQQICTSSGDLKVEIEFEDITSVANPDDFKRSEDNLLITYGEKLTSQAIKDEHDKEEKKNKDISKVMIDNYYVRKRAPKLQFRASVNPDFEE